MSKNNDMLKQIAKYYMKKLIMAAAKKLLVAIFPLMIPIAAVFLILSIFISVTYSAMPREQHLTGVKASETDKVIYKKSNTLTNEWNVADYYMVSGESSEDTSWYKSIRGNGPSEDGTGPVKINNLYNKEKETSTYLDNNGADVLLANKWGDAYSIILFDLYQKGANVFPEDRIKPIVKELHPYFFVKESQVTECFPVTDSKGKKSIQCTTYPVYLLVEAKTIRGWYQYKYEWHTERYPDGGSKKYERLKDTITLEKWQWIENYLIRTYNLDSKEKTTARMFVMNSSDGFTSKKEKLDWLIKELSGYTWLSSFMVPPEQRPFYEQAEKSYGIPWWFLAAIALKESSFDPLAVNDSTGCFGLMGVSPENWRNYAPKLGFDTEKDRNNPRAQVMMGAFLLYEQGLKSVVWTDKNWKEQTLNVLVFYGGFRGPLAVERCRAEYASGIWEFADKLKEVKVGWPVQGRITSYFGRRQLWGKWEIHDGIDIGVPVGTPVQSVSGGVAEVDSNNLSGLFIRVRDLKYSYSYAHLSKQFVANGDKIVPGQIIGLSGNTGRSDGPHLHFGIRNLETNQWVDPIMFLGNTSPSE